MRLPIGEERIIFYSGFIYLAARGERARKSKKRETRKIEFRGIAMKLLIARAPESD